MIKNVAMRIIDNYVRWNRCIEIAMQLMLLIKLLKLLLANCGSIPQTL